MKPKRLPRLWCALQGLLPLEECVAAQVAELAWPRNLPASGLADESEKQKRRIHVASAAGRVKVAPRGAV